MENEEKKAFSGPNFGTNEFTRSQNRKKHIQQLESLDSKSLLKMSDKQLATWQGEFESNEAQWVLADQEWKRRGGIATRRIALAAIAVSVFSLLIAAASYIYPGSSKSEFSRTSNTESSVQQLKLPVQLPPEHQRSSQTSRVVNPTNLTGIHE